MFPLVSALEVTQNPSKAGYDHTQPESGLYICQSKEKNKTEGGGGVKPVAGRGGTPFLQKEEYK